ncbi:MAG: hypothetical protein R3C28_31030 [Pirellulaceae bacterium]
MASAERITSLQNAIFDKYPEFVVPLSFLLDAEGNMLAIYRGAVEIPTLLQDLSLAQEDNDHRRQRMVPLPGTWFTKAATDSEFIEFAAARVFAFDQDQGLRYFADAIAAAESTERQQRLQGKLVATLQLEPHRFHERRFCNGRTLSGTSINRSGSKYKTFRAT